MPGMYLAIIPPPSWPQLQVGPCRAALSNLLAICREQLNCQNDCRYYPPQPHMVEHSYSWRRGPQALFPLSWDVETWARRDKQGVRARNMEPRPWLSFCCLCCVLTWLATVPSCWFEHYSGVSVRCLWIRWTCELVGWVRQTALPIVWVGLIQPVDWLEQKADSLLSRILCRVH